jgi:ATPase subunit of ABC transporter with duplicated ATPase domains
MILQAIRFHRVQLAYEGGQPVLADVELHLAPGWTGVVGANGAGKTTLVRLAVGALPPSRGAVAIDPDGAIARLCEQRVDEPGSDVLAAAASTDRLSLRWLERLELDPSQLERWKTLSAGERKRWQLAGALVAEPDILALDEPTNHLDASTRTVVLRALRRFRGIGIVVSHDRALLDELTTTTIRVDGGTAAIYAGGYSTARALWDAEVESRRAAWASADAERKRASRRLADARRTEASATRAISASTRLKGPRDADGRSMGAKNLAAWAAAGAGRVVARRRRDAQRADAAAAALSLEKARGRAVTLGWEAPPRAWLASLHGVTLRAGAKVIARDVHAAVARDARVHVAGPNGAGKSTLLAALVAAAHVPADRLLWLPQELDAAQGLELAAEVAALPRAERGRVGQLAAALGLDPARALASQRPSPGEARKLALALGLARRVWLAVLDEPTNHLDLPSIERLQGALTAYRGSLIIATHDAPFAAALTTRTWALGGGVLSTT